MTYEQQVLSYFGEKTRHEPRLRVLARRLHAFLTAGSLREAADSWVLLIHWTRPSENFFEIDHAGLLSPAATERFQLMLDVLDSSESLQAGFHRALGLLLAPSRSINLFATAGIPGDRGFFNELSDLILDKLLPSPRDDQDLSRLLRRMFATDATVNRFQRQRPELLHRFFELMTPSEPKDLWRPVQAAFADGFRLLAVRVQAQGLSHKLRKRSKRGPIQESAFFQFVSASDALMNVWQDGGDLQEAVNAWTMRVIRCREMMQEISRQIESEGVSIDIVYGLEVLERCLTRMTRMVGVLMAPPGHLRTLAIHHLLDTLITAAHKDRSIRHFIRWNLRLLDRKIVERSGETGEHYIARSMREYRGIWLAAAGGGLLTTLTAAGKIKISALQAPLFIEGLLAGINYAISFLILQRFGLMLATKQPAMTAASLAEILRCGKRDGTDQLTPLVDFMVCIIRSQLAAALSNVVVVSLGALLWDQLWRWAWGNPFVTLDKARAIYETMSPVNSGTVFYAALTGVILWMASLIGGWVENWSTYHRLPQGIADHPLGEVLGRSRMERWGQTVTRQIAGWGTNISLGLLLGLTPVVGHFFGLPLDVRHVTLSTGTLVLAMSSLGPNWFSGGWFLLAVSGIVVMFVLNLSVSFSLSLWNAMGAYDLPRDEVRQLFRQLLQRFRQRPRDFLIPPA